MAAKMMMIFSKEELARCKSCSDNKVVIDLHKMTKNKAYRFISNLIAICNPQTHIILIHGYNNGTVLRDMLRGESFSKRCSIVPDTYNDGRTHFYVA